MKSFGFGLKTDDITSVRKIRQPAVAGMFYPDDPAELRKVVNSYLRAAKSSVPSLPKALIAPHAGYVYSGPIAGSAYVHLLEGKQTIRHVVLIGPSHRFSFQGIAVSRMDAFASPLGPVPLNRAAIDQVTALPQVCVSEEAHAEEHSLEVQLPFLQMVLGEFQLTPLAVGNASDQDVAGVIDALWNGKETAVVISSDLTHYLDYATAQKIDLKTSAAIEALRPEDIATDDACGAIPIRGFLRVARKRGLQAKVVDLRNSGDTAGSRDRVVGYGAYLFIEK